MPLHKTFNQMPDSGLAALTVEQFCKRYNMGKSSLYRLWVAGLGPAKARAGRKVLIPVAAAEKWLQRITQTSVCRKA